MSPSFSSSSSDTTNPFFIGDGLPKNEYVHGDLHLCGDKLQMSNDENKNHDEYYDNGFQNSSELIDLSLSSYYSDEDENEEEDNDILPDEMTDHAAILSDVANYIKSLKLQIQFWEKMAMVSPLNMKMGTHTWVLNHAMNLKYYIDQYRAALGPSHWDRPAIQAFCLMHTLPDTQPWIQFKLQRFQDLDNFKPLVPKLNLYDYVQWQKTYDSMVLSCSEFEYRNTYAPSVGFPTNMLPLQVPVSSAEAMFKEAVEAAPANKNMPN